MATKILVQSGIAAAVATLCLFEKWPVTGLASAILALGLATTWINTAYVRSSRSGSEPPRWLAKLERLRQYLANEGDEPRTTAPVRQ